MKNRAGSRRGVFTVAVIVVLILVATLLIAFTRSIVSQSRQSRDRHNHRQASWLAESGLERAKAQLGVNKNYKGETWVLNSTAIAGGAEVIIVIAESDGNSQEQKRIEVIARFPLDIYSPASSESQLNIPMSSTGDGA